MQTVETLNEGLKRAYTLTITAKDIDKRVEAELKTVAPQVRMPGFRPGKVPANLVRKMHGPALQQDALNSSIQEGVQKILADNKLRPAMQPAVELAEGYEPGKDAEITVSLEVLPQVPTPQIDGLKLERLTAPVTDAQIDEAVARIAAQNKSWDDAKPTYKAKTGDLVTMDFVGKVGGEEFAGGKGEGMAIEIGSGQLIPGFEDQLVGVKANDEKTIEVAFPENYNAKHLAGKPATFDLVITAVKTPKETVADEEFAKALGLEGLDQLRELFKGQIEQEHNGLTRTHMKRRLLDQLAAAHDFDVPPSMVEAEFNQIWAQLEHEASHEEDPEAARAEMEKDREDYRAIAVRRVRLGLLLSEIGQANGVEVTQQEMNRLVQQAAQQYNPQDRERFVQYIQQEPMAAAQLRAPLYEDKVVDFLFSKAEISEREVSRAEIEAEIESEDDAGHVHGPGCGHDHHDHDHAKPKAAKKAAPKKVVSEEAKAEDAAAKPAAKKAAPKKTAAAEEAPAPAKKPAAKKVAAAKDEAPAKPKPVAKKPAAKKAEG
ncbi:trigger factor [Sphingomonas flavalba]|uniref:trigger factor n=1 Tax=Sphingomonas flavalba TaxID=2559804 RepID=UPI00109E3581|nr:trigger factor [Sphingomonas flavalba]